MNSFFVHCATGLVIRLFLIVYANFHDRTFALPYTDVDYRVYTDAARLIVNGSSPFDRHTYRYTPFLAAILTPNILVHSDFGKVIFSLLDIVVSVVIKTILLQESYSRGKAEKFALIWLYNPLTIVVTTRGNADSLAVFLVLVTLYYLKREKTILAGLLHGLSIHFRLYPIAFSLSMYLSLGKQNILPNVKQSKLVFSCLISLFFSTSISYYFYGYKYLYESVIYHLVRKDARHNFSVFFYMTYLSTVQPSNIVRRFITLLPQLLLLVALSFRYSSKCHLPFAMFTQAMVMVTYNSVMTSQYFYWFLSILPLCLPRLKISKKRFLVLLVFWLASQGLWLFNAYLLEFKSINTFYRIWVSGIVFFLANLEVLKATITHYDDRVGIKKNE